MKRPPVILGIMQPYFLPYIGYYQLISAVDIFIIYDNIKYTKKGWINRNRMLLNGADKIFSLPLQKNLDNKNVDQRELAGSFDRTKLLNKFKGAYSHAPYFTQTLPLLERVVLYKDGNLFHYIHHAILQTCGHLGINTEIRISSEILIDHSLKGQDKVLALCKAVGADTYLNAIGGMSLYSKNDFKSNGVDLQFINSLMFEYHQFGAPFVPWLSIIDVLMFNPIERVRKCIVSSYEMI